MSQLFEKKVRRKGKTFILEIQVTTRHYISYVCEKIDGKWINNENEIVDKEEIELLEKSLRKAKLSKLLRK